MIGGIFSLLEVVSNTLIVLLGNIVEFLFNPLGSYFSIVGEGTYWWIVLTLAVIYVFF
ncbi:MAG: hypothetical protein V1834_01885 [Candidatus Micrarchaeota archaeon]